MSGSLLSNRLTGTGTTIFAEMSALAAETGSINLGQGFPDEDGPPEVIEAAVSALRSGRGNQYTPGPGIAELRTAVAQHQHRHYQLEYDPRSEVLITAGATEAIAAALLALINPGDEVIAFEPYYDSYGAGISMAGGVRVPVTLHPPSFRPDISALKAAISPRTKAILLNSPHNPTGTVFSASEIAEIAVIAKRHDLLVIADEVYEHLVYEGDHIPIATMPGMRDRTVSVGSAGKMFSFTGWKIGWVTGAPEIVSAVRTAKQFLTYVSGGPLQYAVAEALSSADAFVLKLRDDLRRKRDILCEGLAKAGLTVYWPDGTYFVTTDISGICDTDGLAFTRSLPDRCGVVAIPNVVFYDNTAAGAMLVRFAFCKRDDVLQEAITRIRSLTG